MSPDFLKLIDNALQNESLYIISIILSFYLFLSLFTIQNCILNTMPEDLELMAAA